MNAVIDKAKLAEDAKRVIDKAVVHVKVYHPFFGALLSRLKPKIDWRHPTMYTDAVVLGFNPEFVMQQRWEKLLYIVVHEVEHCALRHPFRRGKRDPELYNDAADHVVNLALNADPILSSYFDRNEWAMPEERFKGLAVEQVYAILESERAMQPPPPEPDEQGEESGLSGGTGKVGDCCDAGASGERVDEEEEEQKSKPKKEKSNGQRKGEGGDGSDAGTPQSDSADEGGSEEPVPEADADDDNGTGGGDDADGDDEPDDDEGESEGEEGDGDEEAEGQIEIMEGDGSPTPAALAQLEREWSEAVTTAVLAAGGDMGEGMLRAIGEAGVVRRSFEEYVDQFAQRCFAVDESWSRPNRRFASEYLPARNAPAVKVMVAGIDTSGSISDGMLASFQDALQKIADDFRCEVRVLYCDTRIRHEDHFGPGEAIKIEPHGGGGTAFSPVFSRALELIDEGIEVAGVVYLTDLQGHVDGWQKYMHIETLWVSTEADLDNLWYGAPAFGTICSIFD